MSKPRTYNSKLSECRKELETMQNRLQMAKDYTADIEERLRVAERDRDYYRDKRTMLDGKAEFFCIKCGQSR